MFTRSIRPLAHWFLPECKKLRQERKDAIDIITPLIERRRELRRAAIAAGQPLPVFHDAIDWSEQEAEAAGTGASFDPVILQLTLSLLSIHTTYDLLQQTMIDLGRHPEYIEPLRKEVVQLLREEGWKKTTLFKMKLLDSAIKESQRMKPGSIAPHTADVDDTAKALLAFGLVNHPSSPDTMIKVFEGKEHFTTFGSERDPSLTSNLHVLLCLLKQPDVSQYHSQILKSTLFICQWWWDSDNHVKDKWNLSHLYPTMLLVEAFTELLHLIDGDELSSLFDENLKCKIGLSLFQAVLRIVLSQDDDGSWRGYREQTCYAILALAQARQVCFFTHMLDKLQSCIDRGVSWLKSRSLHCQDLIWTSKTAYEVGFVAEAYRLAALRSASLDVPVTIIGHSLTSEVPSPQLEQYMRLVRKTALFSPLDEWELRASIVESSFFVPLLQAQRVEIFPRDKIEIDEDKYLSIIPFTWIGCNNRACVFLSNRWLYDMMYLSLLGYQIDEYKLLLG
ncbi:ent-kaur-16-ene synthase [Fusarium napiforme]|uniref:Ent-kaur-16-ene synthase n=1 Tax=Fusarium napiforme TaxID=42672 RepID=A0A8H5JSE1_9HYPO|nr:ent-kaur-16-ene synthase [Fusarium napiforme]